MTRQQVSLNKSTLIGQYDKGFMRVGEFEYVNMTKAMPIGPIEQVNMIEEMRGVLFEQVKT